MKIKPLRKKHRFLQWLKKLLWRESPSKQKNIDEVLALSVFYRMEPVEITAEVTDHQLDGLLLTEAEMQCRLQRALAEILTKKIIEEELYTMTVHEDAINFEKQYRATVRIYASKKEEGQG